MYSDSEEDTTSQASNRPRRVSLVGNAIDAEELCKGLNAAATSSSAIKTYEPGLEDEEELDESQMTQEQIGEFFFEKVVEKSKKNYYFPSSIII